MEKRLILAIALSVLIIVALQQFTAKPPSAPTAEKIAVSPLQRVSEKGPSEFRPPKTAPAGEREFEIETDKYMLTFSNIGGSLKRIALKEYRDAGSGGPLNLVDIKDPTEYIFALSDPRMPQAIDTLAYDFEKRDNSLIYSLRLKDLEITKTYIFPNANNSVELKLDIKNLSESPATFTYRLIGGSGIIETNPQDKRFNEVISKIDGKTINFKQPKSKRIINPGIVSWTALKNKYFSVILKPFIQTKSQFYSETSQNTLLTGIESQDTNLPPHTFIENKFVLYIGPSKISTLKSFGFEFEETVNYGFFGGITKLMLAIMGLCYNLVHSWGVSIIILAVLLNVVLFPLTMQSFKSMKKMQEIQPQMEKLKSQCKDNPQKLNKEMMELYKKHKINPLSGCLPLLLQMPIFVALYQALIKSVDLRGARFLWIKDLSIPDAVRIPFALPLIGNSINILPILMIIGMFVQQKISTAVSGAAVTEEQKQQQKMMLIVMPIMFGFIFYNMPSGLVLYWVINTVLTTVEQAAILKKE